ncbi:outer membrane beta-barrel protein [Sediminibacterium sp.]|uniref:outer membrane beta-barrel protein n=1 Tax=Sediminibacterium sp. TaxID=1917865 RepID=UPI003F70338B
MTNKEFDIIFNQKLQQYSSPVSTTTLWDKIAAHDLSEPREGFDDYIQDKLYHYTAPVPSHLWNKIKPDEEDKRRVIAWFPKKYMAAASILLLFFVGSIAAYLYLRIPDINTTPAATKTTEPIVDETPEAATKEGLIRNEKTGMETKTQWKLNRKNITRSFKQDQSIFPFDQTIENNKAENNAGINSNNIIIDSINTEASFEGYELSEKAGNAYIKQQKKWNTLFTKEVNKYNHASSFKNVVICPTDRKMRNPDWDLEVFFSPDIPFKTVTNNTASTQLMSRKDSSESLRPGFTAGFRIVKPLNDHFSIKTGLQYSQINERFTYRTENETRTTTVISVRAIIRAPGDTLLVRDTSTLTQIGFKTNTVTNRYRSLDIPILASYQMGNDDLRIGLTAGAIINISSWYQGVMLDSSLSTVALNKETNMAYKSNIGLGLYAGISVTKRINYTTQLFFEPYFRYNLSNMTRPEASFNQRFSIGGLMMGLRFNLNKR